MLVRHLGLSRTLAGIISDTLSMPELLTAAYRGALVQRSKRIEAKADGLAVTAREIAARMRDAHMLRSVIDEIEDTADALDECCFLLSLLPEANTVADSATPLVELADIATESVGHLVRAVEAASRLPQGRRIDAADALASIDAVVNAERRADVAARSAFAALMTARCTDARALIACLEIARMLETSTDHLSHSALSLRDRVLEELSA